MANRAKGDDAGRSSSQPGAGVQSGLAFKESLKGCEKNLAEPADEESMQPKPRGQKPAGGSFKFG